MRNARVLLGAIAALSLSLTACGTTLQMKSYPIESSTDTYKRLRVAVPTAAAGAQVEVKFNSGRNASALKTVVDPQNILAIVQHEVMKNLQTNGKKVALVTSSPDLDLQISFQAPSATIDLIGVLTLGALTNYQSLGGAKLVDVKTGKVLFAYEFISSVRNYVPPTNIQDWEKFAKTLAEEVNKSLSSMKLAQNSSLGVTAHEG